ncbi:MAG: hypothetical protein WD894_20605 [Pirellulales bacterium]
MDIGAYEVASNGLGSAGNDVIYVKASADGAQLEFFDSNPPTGSPVLTWHMNSTSSFLLDTLAGDDELIVQLPAGTSGPPGGILYEAGSGTNRFRLLSGTIRVDSTASGGTLNTTVETGAHLSTSRLTQNDLALHNNSRVTLLPSGQTSVITSLSLGPDATFDIGDNALVLDYSGASPIDTIRDRILAGRGGPGLGASWTGTGITSSAVAQANQTEAESRSIGYADNALLPLGAYSTFRGVPVDDTAVLIAYTRTGDANLDSLVDDDDATLLGASYAPTAPGAVWALADFDYNGFVDDDDTTLLGVFYTPSVNGVPALPTNDLVGMHGRVPKDDLVDLLAEAIAKDGQSEFAGLASLGRRRPQEAWAADHLWACCKQRIDASSTGHVPCNRR